MFWDKVFWVWFLISAIAFIYILQRDFSRTELMAALVFVGIGIAKLAEESRRKKMKRNLLDIFRPGSRD
jgi:hypothetical protein